MRKTDKITLRSAMVIVTVALIAVTFGCKNNKQQMSDDTTIEKMNQQATEAGESLNKAAEKTGDKAGEAGEAIKETAEKVADKTKEVASDAGDAIEDTMEDTSDKMSD